MKNDKKIIAAILTVSMTVCAVSVQPSSLHFNRFDTLAYTDVEIHS